MGGAAVCDATAGGWRLIGVGHQLRTSARWARASLLLPAAYALVVAGMVLTGWGTVSWVLTPGFAAAPLAPLSVAPASAAGLALTERDAYVVGGDPKYLLQDPGKGRLYVSDFRNGEVAAVDTDRGLVEKRLPAPAGPVGLALSTDGSSLYIAGYGADEVWRVDPETGVVQGVATGLKAPWDILLVEGPGGRELLAVTAHHEEKLVFLDAVSLELVASISTAEYPYGLALAPDGNTLYTLSYGGVNGGRLLAVNLGTLAPLWRTRTGKGSFGLAVSPYGGRIVVTDFVGETLTVIGEDGELLNRVLLEGKPRSVVVGSGGGKAYVTLQAAAAVAVVDLEGGEPVETLPVGGRPGAMIPYAGDGSVGDAEGAGEGPALAVANQKDGTISILGVGEPVPRFADLEPGDTIATAARVLSLRGTVNGYITPDGGRVFRPEGPLARAQAAKILVEVLGLHTTAIEGSYRDFVDVSEGRGYPFDYVQEAGRAGIILGFGGAPPRFGPYQDVTRIQLLRMVVRAAKTLGSPLPVPAESAPFLDVAADSPDREVVDAGYAAGLVRGREGEDGRLRLHQFQAASRGEAVAMVFTLLGGMR